MYDYVLQYGFDIESENNIQNIKKYLKDNNIKDKERKWRPHITIDLYDCTNQNEFIEKVDSIVNNIKCFELECKNLNDFDKETLYIDPYNKDRLLELKLDFDNVLNDYRKLNRKERIYKPHITLCTNENINQSLYDLTNNVFEPFVAKVEKIWIYNQNMELIKEYKLKKLGVNK